MAEVFPFRGVRYDEAAAGSLRGLIAPPYDVIDNALRDELYARNDCNVVRLILPKPGPHPEDPPYAAAAARLRDWLACGVLRRDAQPAIYVYEQRFTLAGRGYARTGMIANVRLADFGKGVHPHEHTLSGPKADRLNLLRATRTNFGQIFALYPDPAGAVDALLEAAQREAPLAAADGVDGIDHRLWAITAAEPLARIAAAMRPAEMFIADGHHRYETALNYRREHPESRAARFRMMTLVNMASPGLVILPTHRLLKRLPRFNPARLLEAARGDFAVETLPGGDAAARPKLLARMRALGRPGVNAFGLYLNDGNHYLLTLRRAEAMAAAPHGDAWRRLDVAVLHALILEKALGISAEDLAEERYVEYVKDIGPAIAASVARIDAGECQALFLMNATRADDVRDVAAAGERMPQKSTFFYPKVYTGIVMRALAADDLPAE